MKNFQDKRIISIYLIVFALLIIGVTYALQSSSLAFQTSTALIQIDETAYGNTSFDSSNLEFKPILDSAVETSTNNVIKIEFKVGGAEANNANNIIYDIALNDLEVNCSLLSPYIKWKLLKNGTEISNGSLDYKFDTIADGRMVLTTIQQDLPDYNATDKSQYDDYIFYMWFSDSCQSSDLSDCLNNNQLEDQSAMINQNLSGKVEVELYTESKKELVRNPSSTLDTTLCRDGYLVTFNLDGGSLSSSPYYVNNGQPYGQLPIPTKETTVITYDTQGGTLASGASSPQEVNWTFNGWYLENNFTNLITNDTIVTIANNHTLYAKWIADSSNTLPNVTRSGCIFQGWYSAATGGRKIGDAGDNYKVGGTVTLYARWKPKTYTVNYNANIFHSNSKTENGVTVTYDSTNSYLTLDGTQTGNVQLSALSGYSFTEGEQYQITLSFISGTYTRNSSGCFVTDLYMDENNGLSTRNYKDLAFPTSGSSTGILTVNSAAESEGNAFKFWIWANESGAFVFSNYKIKVNVTKVESSKTVTYDSTYGTLPTPFRAGYTSNGWFTSESGGTNITSSSKVSTASDHTLHAQWTANTYTVTLNNQSATSAGTTSVTATYGSTMPTITKPERKYTVTYNANGGSVGTTSNVATYTFTGYYTETSGNGIQYYNSSGNSARDWNLVNNTTLYANWNTGSVTLPTPSRSNWTFNGWYTAASGGTKIGNAGASYTPSENITLYAQWSPNVTNISATSYTTHYTASTTADRSVTIKVTYADGSTQSVPTTAASYTTNNNYGDYNRYTFTVSYGGKSTTYSANKLGWYGSGGTWYYYLVPYNSGNSIERITQASYNSYWSGKAKGTKLAGNWAKILQVSRGKYHWYYFNSDGTMKTGWWNSGSAWYYFVENGVTVTNWNGPIGSMVACTQGNEAEDTASTCPNSGNRTISGSSTASWNGTYQFDYSGRCISSNC
ncbi:MAG: InlB B-repeat-containing protein [Erysipelotrichaceae bacterium]|nr:InlB B-repeat-containing protein [Erysipelotrichaceae bacterium]